MDEGNSTLGTVDYVILSLMLLFSASIGVYYRFTGGKQKTTKEYLLADGNMSIIPVSLSVMVSLTSAITTLGVSSEMYSFGTMYMLIILGYAAAVPIVIFCYLPVFYNLQATSAYEYLERRFGVTTRTATSIAFFIYMTLYNSVVLYAPSLALSAVTGISLPGSIITVGLVCTFYSVLGGMKAILMTDAFQACLMVIGITCVVIKGTIDAGGPAEIWQIAQEGKRIEFINFNPDPTVRHTFWSLTFGGISGYLISNAVNQTQVQRLLTVNSLKKARLAVSLSWPVLAFICVFTGYSGLVVYARYFSCDPYKQGRIDSFDQILPLFVMDSMSNIPGLAGIFIAGVFSASLSTISSTLNSLAAITMEDYIKPILKRTGRKEISDGKTAIITQLIATFNGFLCIGLAFLAGGFSSMLQLTLTLSGAVGGPILGVFTLGMFFWTANETGAVAGLTVSLAISMWIGFGGPKPPLPYLPTRVDGCKANESLLYYESLPLESDEDYFWLYKISYLWYGTIGVLVVLIVGVTASAIHRAIKPSKAQEKIDPNLLSPAISRFLPRDKMLDVPSETALDMK